MRRIFTISFLVIAAVPGALAAQEPIHVAIEATSLVLDEARLRRSGFEGAVISSGTGGAAAAAGRPDGNVLIGGRIGELDVSAWLDLVRRESLVERESTQRIVVLSGSAAQIASRETVVGPFGHWANAGPTLWVEPVALADGLVRLRVGTAIEDIRPGPYGTVRQEVLAEGSTEIVVPSGTSVVIASTEFSETSAERGVLSRGRSSATRSAWIVVRARIVSDAEEAFPMPPGIPEEWLRP